MLTLIVQAAEANKLARMAILRRLIGDCARLHNRAMEDGRPMDAKVALVAWRDAMSKYARECGQ